MKKLLLLCVLTLGFSQMLHSQEYGWTDISENIPGDSTNWCCSGIYFVSDNESWITNAWEPEIYHTTDGGETFEIQTTEYHCHAIHMLNENEGYAGGKNGRVYKTTDGGENWIAIGSMGTTLTDISFPPSGNTGYCCGINGNIWSIDSSGVTKMTSNVNGHLYSISFPINSEEGWVCGGDAIRHYKNSVWNGDKDYPSGGYNAIYMVDSLNGWTVGDYGIIAHTEDGHNWFEQINPNPNQNTLFDLFFLDENNGWAIGSGGTIVHTNNGGENWNLVGAGLASNSLTGVHFTSPTNGYAVGIGKTLLKYTEVSGVEEGQPSMSDFEIYPNPTANEFKVKSSKFKVEGATIELSDLNGKKLLEKNVRAGTETIEIDVSSLKSRIYFCKVSTEKYSATKKLIIQK